MEFSDERQVRTVALLELLLSAASLMSSFGHQHYVIHNND